MKGLRRVRLAKATESCPSDICTAYEKLEYGDKGR
jgi:hypothetical protein